MKRIADEIAAAAKTVLAAQGEKLDATAVAALVSLQSACDAAFESWQAGKIQEIGHPGVPRKSGVSKLDIAAELAGNKQLGLNMVEASEFIEDVLFNAIERARK